MCNAWNHPPDCACGWGGYGHLGRHAQAVGANFRGVPPLRGGESFVIPNARCPVCDAPVFFYQSADGGRVFFDELGPPWPKHPCTNRQSIPKQIGREEAIVHARAQRSLPWQADGWRPFVISQITPIDGNATKLSGAFSNARIDVYMGRHIMASGAVFELTRDTIVLARTSPSGDRVELSLLARDGCPVMIVVYSSLQKLREQSPRTVEVRTKALRPPPREKDSAVKARDNREFSREHAGGRGNNQSSGPNVNSGQADLLGVQPLGVVSGRFKPLVRVFTREDNVEARAWNSANRQTRKTGSATRGRKKGQHPASDEPSVLGIRLREALQRRVESEDPSAALSAGPEES